MRVYTGQVKEIHIDSLGDASALITCHLSAVPPPGRYLLAVDDQAVLGTVLFQMAGVKDGFITAPSAPNLWEPGTQLTLHGPLGVGFFLPVETRRLGVVAPGGTISRLLPLAESVLRQDIAVSLFSDAPLPALPSAIEASPVAALPEALAWADFLVIDLPLDKLPALEGILDPARQVRSLCPGQVLIHAPMPCVGLADCGVCALKTRRGWKLACKDGPVFMLEDLLERG